MPKNSAYLCKHCGEENPENFYSFVDARRGKRYPEKSRCKKCSNGRRKHYDTFSRTKDKHLRGMYGISLSDYFELLIEKQKGKCAGCLRDHKKDPQWESRMWPVDHSHVTEEVRGILCHQCNKALGFARDSVEVLEGLIIYLKRGGQN